MKKKKLLMIVGFWLNLALSIPCFTLFFSSSDAFASGSFLPPPPPPPPLIDCKKPENSELEKCKKTK